MGCIAIEEYVVTCDSQLWAIQHTWSTATIGFATRAGKSA